MSEEQQPSPLYLIILDPSLNRSGWAVFDITGKPKLFNYGYIDNNHFPTERSGNKLIHLEMTLQTIKFAYSPCIVLKESWVPPNNGKYGVSTTAAQTAYLLAAVHGTCAKVFNQHKIIEENNKTFKREFTGNGNAEKEDVAEYVQKYRTRIWSRNKPLLFRSDDESDAIGLGINWLIKNERIKRVE